jgi:hypothetical protein
MSENITLSVDTSAGEEALAALDKRIDEIVNKENTIIQTTEHASKMSYNRIISIARLSWSMVDQVFQAFGVHMSTQWRLLIQSGFSIASTLYPIFAAEAAAGDYARAALGFGELAIAITALVQAQMGQAQAAQQTGEAARAIYTIGNFIHGISYL